MADELGLDSPQMKKNQSSYGVNNMFGDNFLDAGPPLGVTPQPKKSSSMAGGGVMLSEDTSIYYKRAGSYIEYGNEVKSDLSKSKVLKFVAPPAVEETDEEDDVYPLSIRYNKKKACKIMIFRYIFLLIFILIVLPSDLYTFGAGQSSDVRLGYFADKITEFSLPIAATTDFEFQIKDCRTYILENTASTTNINVYISAERDTSIKSTTTGTTITTEVLSSDVLPRCYVELKIPGGVTLNSLKFTYNGDKIQDVILSDTLDGSTWATVMDITTLTFEIDDSLPVVTFQGAHTIASLDITGTYCLCSFETTAITVMNYDVDVGSLYIVQNSAFTENRVQVETPDGLH